VWLLKRALSNDHGSNLSIVMNLRGRCDVDDFDNAKSSKSDLFGNGISNGTASLAPSLTGKDIEITDVGKASRAIRRALLSGLEKLPDRLAQSRLKN